ncbi:hypothetical protein NSZ01_37960 [Nocardioides szechwanensis]|uniref:HEAT repeat-containing protein n=1 Tax=Nocardioides szechwanensis TaxID=1005944 RepID=A0A1H0LRN4_9ACTN|nr:HEAT repeat domain-containing protein [Nocardioides szechwanensis]GEP36028.1 hypothetical protein NSZ01_37960 [Nocardioides szechwanensis]SDO70919.1 HEAT repeat-containing protein [Nocardioides szechwanensis]
MSRLPPPRDLEAPIPVLVRELVEHLGGAPFVAVCTDLLGGADRGEHLLVLPYLTGHTFADGDATRDPDTWPDLWVRAWGARGLLHVWDDLASDAVVAGLGDVDWRPAEMCLKVAARHEVGGAGDGAARLATHELPRVRTHAMRALGAVGDTEHVEVVRERLDDEHADVRRAAARALERLAMRLDLEPIP